jgi:hypothetical protein
MSGKQRLSASVDADLIAAAEDAAARGEVATVSAWVNDALRLKLEHDRRLHALAAFVAEHESEHGEITPSDIDAAVRRARGRAVVIRGVRTPRRRTKR